MAATAFVASLLVTLVPGNVRADPPPRATTRATSTATSATAHPPVHYRHGARNVPLRAQRFWNPGFRALASYDYVNAAVSVTWVSIQAGLLETSAPPIHFSGPILFDDAVRNALRAPTPEGRKMASDASWGLMVGLMVYPVAVDVPVAWARGGSWLAWQFLWQDVIVLASATAVDTALRDAVGRARPDVAECMANGGQNCTESQGTQAARSFPGGHVAAATAGAALICTQHLHTHLYGGPWDGAVCGSALASSVAVGLLRIVADAHNATDILAGALLGGLIGGLAPSLMWYPHHRHVPFAPQTPPRAMLAPYPLVFPGGGGGLGVTGMVF